MPLLELDGFGVDIAGKPLLHELNLKLGEGQTVGIAGNAGAGKTALALALAGMLPAEARQTGKIFFDRSPLPRTEAAMARLRGRRIGFIFGDGRAGLDPRANVADQLAAVLRHRGGGASSAAAALSLLARCRIDAHVAQRYPHELTPMQRRLSLLALALSGEPDLLVADDPAAGLDPVSARTVLDQVSGLVRERGIAKLLLVRDFRALTATCTDVMVLSGGSIVEFGPPSEVFGRPQHDHTREMVAASRMRTRTLMRSPIGTDLLTVTDLSFPLPRHVGPAAPAGLSFAVRRSEALAIVGLPGAGKSMIGRIVAGLERARSGRLVFEHDPYRGDDLPAHRRREVGFVFGSAASLDPRGPVAASITEPLRLEPQLLLEEQGERLMEVVRAVGLDPAKLSLRPTDISRDDLARFALARALTARPRLLVVDDLAEGLDLVQRSELLALFGRLRSDYGLSVLLLTRDIDVARAIADRVLILDSGRIVEEGKPADLIDAPQHPVTQALVRARLPDAGLMPPVPTL
jgi:peptide/nickel transport system ATP-binding protein